LRHHFRLSGNTPEIAFAALQTDLEVLTPPPMFLSKLSRICAKLCALQVTDLTPLLASERFSTCRPTGESTAKLFLCHNESESDEGPLRKSELGSVLHFLISSQVGLMHDHKHRVADGVKKRDVPHLVPPQG
jgi:hypothetical protein